MSVVATENYQQALAEQKQEVRNLVLAGLEQIKEDTIYIIRILHMLVDSKAWLYQTLGL